MKLVFKDAENSVGEGQKEISPFSHDVLNSFSFKVVENGCVWSRVEEW